MTYPSGARWFVAVEIPDAVKEDLATLHTRAHGIRWTPPEQCHLTLRFIGPAEPDTVDEITKNLGSIQVEPFVLTPEGVGRFPPRGPAHVLWAGVGTGHPRLFQLQQQVETATIAAGLPPETRRYHPHITLARAGRASPGAVKEFLKQHRNYTGGPFRVDAFHLLTSELERNGPVHRIVMRFDLPAGPSS